MARNLRRQTLSMRGEPVDFEALASRNASTPTLGNTKTNVRGDLLGDNAVVLKTQEQIEAEWARKQALQKTVSKHQDIKTHSPAPASKPVVAADMDFPTVGDLVRDGAIPTSSKRKIVDSD